jgi:hypothetical protein
MRLRLQSRAEEESCRFTPLANVLPLRILRVFSPLSPRSVHLIRNVIIFRNPLPSSWSLNDEPFFPGLQQLVKNN